MKIRFLRTTESAVPGYPFQAGQILDLPRLTDQFRVHLRSGAAEALPDEDEAMAVVQAPRRAVTRRSK